MIAKKVMFAVGIMLIAAVGGFAQTKPGTIASLEFQKLKPGTARQYEEGRKAQAEWHKQQKHTSPLYIWETRSGDDTGTYVVGRLGQHWADFDRPAAEDKGELEAYEKNVGGYVESLIDRFYELLPKESKPTDSMTPSKFSEIITYVVKSGKSEEFHSAISRANEAIEKTKWPVHYYWYVLANGGRAGTYVLVIPHDNWADFEDNPNMKPFAEMLSEAFGHAEADSILNRFDTSTEMTTSSILEFRADLSYLPGK
jgi:hypothetical protein